MCVEGRDQGVIRVISRRGRHAFFSGNMTGPSVNKAFMTPCSGLGTMGGTEGVKSSEIPPSAGCSDMKTPHHLPPAPPPPYPEAQTLLGEIRFIHMKVKNNEMICAKCVVYLCINMHLLSFLGTRH